MSQHTRWEFYIDAAGKHRWRRVASNGEIIAAATQGFSSKAMCIANAKMSGYKG